MRRDTRALREPAPLTPTLSPDQEPSGEGEQSTAERIRQTGPSRASEDFGSFGTEWGVPWVFWFVGDTDAQLDPANHKPRFLPVIHPTLETGAETLVVAARAWLSA